MLLLEVLLTAWAYFPDNWKPQTCNEKGKLFCKIDGWELGGVHFVGLAQVPVLGDVSGAGAGAALGCYWGCCFRVLVMVRAHMDGRVLGRVLFGESWLSRHHDAGRSIMVLTAAP